MYTRYVELRNSAGLTDSQIAEMTGIGKSTFSDWKSGRSKPKVEKLLKIAEVLKCSVEELIQKESE